MPRERIPPSKVERGPSNEIVCSIADHITTNIPFTCYHLYGRNLQTKRHEPAIIVIIHPRKPPLEWPSYYR